MTLLVTGGAGFIGSNFIRYILEKDPKCEVINVDKLTYAGDLENLADVSDNDRYRFIKTDISDRETMDKIFRESDINIVINFAAESHVDRSIEDPEIFLQTNVIGTQVLLDTAKKHWKKSPSDKYCNLYKPGVKFIQISTDEVYGDSLDHGKFKEETPLRPSSPYSASKASADLLVGSYYKTYGLPINITRCSNNYGPYQFPEKLIPLVIYNCLKEIEIPVYGDGQQVRDWLHVLDHCSAIDHVMSKGIPGETYNIGGNCEITNFEIIESILGMMNKPKSLVKFVKDRPGHDRRYSIDNSKIMRTLGWYPMHSIEDGLFETINWYVDNDKWISHITSGEYKDYYQKMYLEF